MKIDIVEIQEGDDVIIRMDIGNLDKKDVDKYVLRHIPKLKKIFGCPITVLPVRNGGWDFTIVRNTKRKKVATNKKR